MKSNETILASAKRTIEIQANCVSALSNFADQNFADAVKEIKASKGRLIISGIGKSAIVAQKIVATMNSTGTPSLFMHAADAIHGDLGMVQRDDIVMVISKSGNSPEIKVLLPLLKNFGNRIIAISGNDRSYLAQESDIVINSSVEQEACPNNLAPTTSTTAQMVMGDALAICLMEERSFNSSDFAKFHPGGALGKKLYLKVSDLIKDHEKPEASAEDNIKSVIIKITKSRLGAVAIVNNEKNAIGIITDGDLRRMLEKYDEFSKITAKDIMSHHPKKIKNDAMAAEALTVMKENNINQLLVTENDAYAGILHLQDLIREGII
jgi:arabinose-5-phosphate isomerase